MSVDASVWQRRLSNLQQALALAAQGFKVFPVRANEKAPPLFKDWPAKATTDEATIRSWWGGVFPADSNIGVSADGFCVLDVDPKSDGNSSFQLLEMTHGFPTTLTVRTPSAGRHLYYRMDHSHPGVANTVGRIGKGLDTRGRGGYCVAPGSRTTAGEYTVENPAPLADAPQWLIDAAGQPRTRDADAGDVPVPDGTPDALERAATWLAAQPEAIEGQGGDLHTFQIACGLRDMGLSEQQALDRMEAWNTRCVPPWAYDDLAAKVRNAYRFAQNAPGGRAAGADDFSIYAEVAEITSPNLRKGRVLRLDQFAAQQDKGPGELVKGLLQRGSYAALIGQPGAGKSFLMFDLGYCVASDQAWMGRRVKGGPVAYLPFEGLGGLVKRAQALRQKYGDGEVPFYILPAAGLNLRDAAGRRALGALIAEMPEPPSLIVVDTFAKAMAGGDENSAQDVGAFNLAIEGLIEATGACVLAIHHSGKDKSKGARGSSALLGALDTELEVSDHLLTATKQRDIELGEPIPFKLVPIIVGTDVEDGEIMSCVVQPGSIEQTAGLPRLNGNARHGFDVLCAMSPDNAPVHAEAWREKCRVEFLTKSRVSASFFELKKKLLQAGYIEMNAQGLVSRRMA